MNAEMIAALRELEREKGIAFETILPAWRRRWPPPTRRGGSRSTPTATTISSASGPNIDPETGDLRIWLQQLEEVEVEHEGELAEGETAALEMKVVSEEEVEVTDDFKGRIGAQTAKQVIFQKLRDAEREMTYEEFAGREGDIVTGIIQQQERRYTLLDLGQGRGAAAAGRAGAVRALPPRRAPEGVHHRGPQGHEGPADRRVAHAPRAAEGAVRARGARDRRGHRRDQGGGARARAPHEDRGVRPTTPTSTRSARASGPRARASAWSSTSCAARRSTSCRIATTRPSSWRRRCSRRRCKEVRIDEATGTAEVIVPDYQLSLAIGKEGQNARLAARLTGWRVDIKSETQVARRVASGGARRRGHAPPASRPPRRPPTSEAGCGRGRLPRRSAPAEEPVAPIPQRRPRKREPWRRPSERASGVARRHRSGAAPRGARSARGEVARRPAGSAPGRGAYVHRDVGVRGGRGAEPGVRASAPDGPDGGCSR